MAERKTVVSIVLDEKVAEEFRTEVLRQFGLVVQKHEPLLTAEEAARYLTISMYTLRKIERRGGLVPYRTPGGHRRYNVRMLDEYLNSSQTREEEEEVVPPTEDPLVVNLLTVRRNLALTKESPRFRDSELAQYFKEMVEEYATDCYAGYGIEVKTNPAL